MNSRRSPALGWPRYRYPNEQVMKSRRSGPRRREGGRAGRSKGFVLLGRNRGVELRGRESRVLGRGVFSPKGIFSFRPRLPSAPHRPAPPSTSWSKNQRRFRPEGEGSWGFPCFSHELSSGVRSGLGFPTVGRNEAKPGIFGAVNVSSRGRRLSGTEKGMEQVWGHRNVPC